ncbi:uncharacterized protein LOC118182199 isoform X3 [Stegodyphus dumicola]|uniref:uncharacterized protein LOC118182199 isoform X3 n=1 Tax=Stegodyphus dumicola TaxID=202533 RepID=UPI0015AF2C02|nr:uncharacterized protein LOC118182199 isoform X3 [Stegodyphus dumicola]
MRIGSLNLRKSRKSTVFASVRGSARNFGSTSEMKFGNRVSTRKKSHKNVVFEKKNEPESKNDSDSDSAYGFYSK